MAGGGKIPSDAGKIRQSERNRTNDDASFKRAEQKFAAQNVEREQKRLNIQRPVNTVGTRIHEREEHPEQAANQGSSDDLAGRHASPIDSPMDSAQTQDSRADYNARRQKTQAAKAEKLAETEQKDLEIKADQAEQQLNYDVQQVNLGQPVTSSISGTLTVPRGTNAASPEYSMEETVSAPQATPGAMRIPNSGSTPTQNITPGATIKAEFFTPAAEEVQTPGGSVSALIGTPGQNGGGIKVTQQGPKFSEDAIVAEPPHRKTENIVEQGALANITPENSAPKDDNYETPLESAKESMRPGFFSSVFGGAKKSAKGKTARGGSNTLRNAEKSASNLDSSFGLDAQTGENEVNSDFVNNVGSQNSQNNAENQKAKSGFLKKKGPLMSIIISLLFGGGGMYMTQASLPFTVLDKLNDTFDSQDISVNKRSGVFTKLMAKNAKNVDVSSGATKKNLLGKTKFSVSKKMRKRMKANNLEIITDKNSPDVGKLKYTDKDGNIKLFTASEFEDAYRNNTDIRKAYDKAAHPWKTSVTDFLDKGFQKVMAKFGLKKRALDGYDAKSDPTGEKARKAATRDIQEGLEDGSNNTRATGGANDDESMLKDDDDSSSGSSSGSTNEVSAGKKKAKAISAKMKKTLNTTYAISQVICAVPTIMTGATLIAQAYQLYQVAKIAMFFMSGVDQARAGDAASSPINMLGRSLVEQSSERRFKSTVTAESDYEESDENDDYGYYEYTTSEEFESDVTETKSAIQSEGLSKLFTGDPVAESDESIESFDASKVLKGKFQEIEDEIEDNLGILGDLLDNFDTASFLTDVSLKADTFKACQFARLVLAYGLLTFDIGMLILSFGEIVAGASSGFAAGTAACAWAGPFSVICGGVGGIIGGFIGWLTADGTKEAIEECLTMAVSWIVSLVASWAASHIATFLVNMLERKAMTEFFGEDLGNAIMSGSHVIMADNHRGGGGLVADKEGYMAMLIYQDAVNAEEAKSDRLARSPFDITSQNTFAGQLAATMTPILWQSDSLLDTVGKFGSTVRNSAKVFLPTASAYDAAKKANYAEAWTEENCENLDSIGAVGDEFCNPYIATDFDTMFADESEDDIEKAENSPFDIMKKVGQSNFKDDIENSENPKIKEDSDLADYILYCSERESAFGYADENIAGRYEKKNDAIGMILDFVGDYRDAKSAQNIIGHFGWVEGSNCVMHEDLEYGEAIDYDDIKNFSRYMEDQRLAESMGVIEESAVSVFLDEYYEKNPKDMSPKAVLARMAGMTTETFDSIMAGIEVVDFIAHYDPTDYYPTPAVHKEDPSYTIEEQRMVEDDGILAVVYENSTNLGYYQRNFAIV